MAEKDAKRNIENPAEGESKQKERSLAGEVNH